MRKGVRVLIVGLQLFQESRNDYIFYRLSRVRLPSDKAIFLCGSALFHVMSHTSIMLPGNQQSDTGLLRSRTIKTRQVICTDFHGQFQRSKELM